MRLAGRVGLLVVVWVLPLDGAALEPRRGHVHHPGKMQKNTNKNNLNLYIFCLKIHLASGAPRCKSGVSNLSKSNKKYKKSGNIRFPSNLGKKIILITSCTRMPRGDLRQSVARSPLASAAGGSTSPRRCSPAGDQKDLFSGKRIWRI